MINSREQGFTLIEIVLVIAITGALLSIAFMGQGQLRAQAQFDASVNKVVSSINDAHNEATAGVSLNGLGTGVSDCGGPGDTNYIFAGVAWVADPAGTYHMDFYKVVPGSTKSQDSCIFNSVKISMAAPIMVKSNPAATPGSIELFVRSNDLLNICPVTIMSTDLEAIFRNGNCTENDLVMDITDDQGRKGQVKVDKSGLAQRAF